MPLRIVTWNSGGEAGARGETLLEFVEDINNRYSPPDVQLVTIQEAAVQAGSIANVLANEDPFDDEFIQPQGFSLEINRALQKTPVGTIRAYRLSWMVDGPNEAWDLTGQGANNNPILVNLSPADYGVRTYIQSVPLTKSRRLDLWTAATNMRWPIYKRFSLGAGAAQRTIHFFSWHAPLRMNHLGANYVYPGVLGGPGFPEAFAIFQHSLFYRNIYDNLGARGIIIIAGDLNLTRFDLKKPWLFPEYVGVSQGLCHILAYNQAGTVRIDQTESRQTQFKTHAILTGRVRW